MFNKTKALLLVLFACTALVRCEISITLSERLANNFTHFLLTNISNQKHVPLPAVSQVVPTDFVDLNITLEPSFLECINFPLNQTKIEFSNQIKFNVLGVSLNISTEVDIKGGLFRKHQPYNMTVYNVGVSGQISLKYVPETSRLALDSFDVKLVSDSSYAVFEGKSLAIISNFVYGSMRSSINAYIDGTITTTLRESLNKSIEAFLAESQYIVPIPIDSSKNETIYLNYTFLNAPQAVNGYLTSSFSGEFFLQGDLPAKKGFMPPALTEHTNDFEMSLTDSSFNSLLSALVRVGVLNLYIKSEQVPKTAFFGLDTSSLGIFLPGFLTTYGAGKKVDVDILVDNSTLPNVQTSPSGLNGSLVASVSFIVRKTEQEKELALNIKTKVSCSLELYVELMKIKGKISSMSLGEFTVVKSTIGNIDTSGLESLAKLAVSLGVPVINKEFSKNGIPIPKIPNVQLDQFNILLQQNNVLITSNVYFNKEAIA